MSKNEIVTQENEAALQMQKTNNVADVCRDIVTSTAINIQGKKYVPVEAWQSIATAHGCVAGAEAPHYLKEGPDKGYQAKGYITHIATGNVISTAYGFVGEDEVTWANRPAYAKQAMAQTRAISRACRSAFAHVVVLMNEGLEVTPAEEVPSGGFKDSYNPTSAKQHTKDIVAANAGSGHWSSFAIPFGKNKGKTLGELAPNSIKWYWEKYQPKEYPEGSGKFSDNDIALRKALDEWGKEAGMEEVEVVKDETPITEIIEATTSAISVETKDDNVPF
jgi:hypothetical protein